MQHQPLGSAAAAAAAEIFISFNTKWNQIEKWLSIICSDICVGFFIALSQTKNYLPIDFQFKVYVILRNINFKARANRIRGALSMTLFIDIICILYWAKHWNYHSKSMLTRWNTNNSSCTKKCECVCVFVSLSTPQKFQHRHSSLYANVYTK